MNNSFLMLHEGEHMTVKKAFERFIFKKKIKNLSPKTLQTYDECIKPFMHYIGEEIEEIDTDLVLAYISTLYNRSLATATRASYTRHIKAFMRWLKDCYNIPVALSEIEIPKADKKLVHILTQDDIRLLFTSVKCESEWLTERNCAILSLMLDSGLRRNEVVTLKWNNVFFDENYVLVCGKGSKERFIPLGTFTKGLLEKYRSLCPFINDYVFVGRYGKPITDNTIKLFVQKLKQSTGLDFSAHKLRHNFATNYCIDSLESTGQCDAFTLQVLMGHENVKTTERYMHYATSMLASRNNHSHLDALFGV